MNWNDPKGSPVSYDVDSVLAQPFATLMNATAAKWLSQMEDMA